jgi:hypothetical protein
VIIVEARVTEGGSNETGVGDKKYLNDDFRARRPRFRCCQSAIATAKQTETLVIARFTKNLLSQAPPCLGTPVQAAFAVVSTHQYWALALGPLDGLNPILLTCNP